MPEDSNAIIDDMIANGIGDFGKDEVCAEQGHVFEVKGDPPYKCTFCGLRHDETDGGKFVRSS